jgi:hypothetical protein
LAPVEFAGGLYVTDLTQAKFTPGSPGTWFSPGSRVISIPEFLTFTSGSCGVAVAPGTHLALVTGEFGGNLEGVVELPSTSGTGILAFPDWVAFTVPDEPNGDELRWAMTLTR